MDLIEIKQLFPLLTDNDLLAEIYECAIERTFASGEDIIRGGQYIKYMPLVLDGLIKVMREDEEGNEMLLYFLEGGNTCAMSITCCMRAETSNIWATAEEETKVLLIPVKNSEDWMKKYSAWRNYVISSYASRMEELLRTIDSIAFKSLDERLLKYLEDRSRHTGTKSFNLTHQEIARELNSSREAISRLLKKLERIGRVKLGRNKLELV